ncbi:hypothetical protein EVJ58_g5179 [Rhodofomes roseus]|uniref:N-acetyltransferase domain-containing protein n=1 Tax=Rhodofomes roseus TaxID=34475 RepID=A0A4Y9YG10_9APHY|nr:hypothetical protein EVJ58_g5179 [Rhodofomes roseus]
MQRKWREDEDKLTFIILAREPSTSQSSSTSEPNSATDASWLTDLPMIGDVNLFLKGDPTDEDFEAEVEIMIAEPAYRRRGLAHTVLQLFLSYATSACHHALPVPPYHPHTLPSIPRTALVARIGMHNAPSIALFAKLGFVETKRVEVFEEVEMRWRDPEAGIGMREWKRGEVREVRFSEED